MIERHLVGPSQGVAQQPASGWLRQALPLAVSVTCLGLLLWLFWDQVPALVHTVRNVNLMALVLAGTGYLLAFYVVSVRAGIVFRVFGICHSSYRFFLYTLIGLFFSNFLPTGVGGDVLKACYAADRADRVAEAFLATFIDRGIGMVGVMLVGAAGLSFFPGLYTSTLVVWLSISVVVCLVALVLACRVERWVEWTLTSLDRIPFADRRQLPRLTRAALGMLRAPDLLLLTLLLTLISLVISSISLWIAALAIGIELDYLAFLFLISVKTLVLLVPSVNGIGVREVAFVIVLQGLVPEERALALAIVAYGLAMICSVLGGVVFLLRKPLGLHLSPAVTSWFKSKA